jgi:two-component system cell cycle sensor histidine kinase/response regulator CckA
MRKNATASSMPHPAARLAAATPPGGLPGCPAGVATILVVEDDHALRELLRLTLESCDFRVLAAANGAEALRIAERQPVPIALLVSDVTMPGMSGPELARRLESTSAGLRVLLLSGYPRETALLDPRVSFLQKPFQPRALLAAVRQILAADAGQAG